MDIIYFTVAGVFWVATVAFSFGCQYLQNYKVTS